MSSLGLASCPHDPTEEKYYGKWINIWNLVCLNIVLYFLKQYLANMWLNKLTIKQLQALNCNFQVHIYLMIRRLCVQILLMPSLASVSPLIFLKSRELIFTFFFNSFQGTHLWKSWYINETQVRIHFKSPEVSKKTLKAKKISSGATVISRFLERLES